jgi:hypothetical protein
MAHRATLPTVTKGGVSDITMRILWLSISPVVGPRCNRGEGGGSGLSTCLCIHAEENALLEAGRERIREGAILYCDTYENRPYVNNLKLTFLVDAHA